MADFLAAYAKTMNYEGTYSNNPKDHGGETWKGVARNYWPDWAGWKIIDAFKADPNFLQRLPKIEELEAAVQDFYKVNFWNRFLGDQIKNQEIAIELFEEAVNMGVSRAIQNLQFCLNAFNRDKLLYDDLIVDGRFGEKTFKALKAFCKGKRSLTQKNFVKALNVEQGHHYLTLGNKSDNYKIWMDGWFARVEITKGAIQ